MTLEPASALAIASTATAILFLLVLPFRLRELWHSPKRSIKTWQRCFAAAPGALLSIILLLCWIKIFMSKVQYESVFLLSLLTSALAAIGLSLLQIQEIQRSPTASDLVTLYLLASILCDIIYLTLPSEFVAPGIFSIPISLQCCIYSLNLVFGRCARNTLSNDLKSQRAPDETYGVLNRVLFTWINPLLLHGYRRLIVDQDLPPLSQDLDPELTRRAMLQAWSQRVEPETKRTLPLALLKALRRPFLVAVIPRLFLIVFRYSQPILIRESIRYVTAYPSDTESNRAFWLIVSAVTVYIGLAISTSMYQHSINKVKLMTLSALVGLIHHHAMELSSIAYDNSEAVTLMSTDAGRLDGIAEMVHETWAQVIEVLIGVILLAREVGWVWPLPIFLIYLCSHMSRFVAKHLQPRQKAWNKATQERIAATNSMVSAMKVVKMLGIQQDLAHRILELRRFELWVASKLRWVVVYSNASANALGIFSPAITLAIYAILSAAQGRDLDTETAFTTVAILGMVTHPANMIMTIVPRVVAAFAGFDRIHSFLLRPCPRANRETLNEVPGQPPNASRAIQIQNVTIGDRNPILQNINMDIVAESLNIITGPTGSGKSTLLRAMLGEVVPSRGSISLSTRQISYCAQRPWLPNGTIREVIYGATNRISDHDLWYREVVELCCLTHDFESLPDGDQTHIGSRGLNLSGGQRQRVALARALFAKYDILFLDDTFSGLDGKTEQVIFENLFGTRGLIRRLKTTVILVSNSSQYFHAADHIVVLSDHRIVEQGSWEEIQVKTAAISKFSSSHQVEESAVISANFDKFTAQLRAQDETEADLARQTGDPALYGYYYGFVGFTNMFLLITCTALYSFFIAIPQYWLQLWTEVGGKAPGFYVAGYLFCAFIAWISTSTQMWSIVIRLAPRSGIRLHQRVLDVVTSAPLTYFSQTDNGSTLNRFSQDIQLIDTQLPGALQSVVTQVLKLVMQVILLCIAQKWLAVSLPVCGLVLYVVQKIYLRTSRQLRFLELQSRAGVFSSFLESMEGLETIRSFGWSKAIVEDNIQCVANSQRPEFIFLCLQRWLNVVLDLLAAAIATSVVALAVALRGHVSGAQVGMALNIMLVTNTTLLKLVENWTTLETSLGAIARLKTLEMMTPREGGDAQGLDPADNWPSRGCIEFKDITASYQSKVVGIRNLSLSVSPGQKLIVCGRTGSGKSTLLLTLLRLLELKSGTIELDGVDIQTVGLDLLRQRCFVAVSQDPLLLPNETLRFNLAPGNAAPDGIVIEMLAKAGLQSHFFDGNTHLDEEESTVISMESPGESAILDRKLSQFKELSVGQCQLFAVCRALVKARSLRDAGIKPVVLLDEVTASLDPQTEATIYQLIEDELTANGHTVIIVAHRLGALSKHIQSGRDVVAVLADGRLQDVIHDLRVPSLQ
ncbi:putative ABC transporter [Nemania sp. FL0916]|nr:putative ABC transporter [Nemania sp. FL0916]